jgi:alkylation response protein AidB-like acyl-CoA dehydrogenase
MSEATVDSIIDGTASHESEVESWLRTSLPTAWLELVDSGRSPGPLELYEDFDQEQWFASLLSKRYLVAPWPTEFGGLGWDQKATLEGFEALTRYEVTLPLYVTSLLLAGSGLLEFGTEEQRAMLLPKIASGEEIWCQLFSEPEAGSDLASLRTKAIADGGRWSVSGQKVWTTWAHMAKWGILLARTGAPNSRHRGITCFILDMSAAGVDIRPLRQLTGDASFNEVFLEEVVIDDSMRLGPVDEGWTVARSVLQAERGALGQRRVGGIDVHRLIDRHRGTAGPVVRQRLADAYTRDRILRMMAWRGFGGGGQAQVVKLLRAEANMDLQTLAVDLEGLAVIAFDDDDASEIRYGFLRSRANSIGGGTSEILRNMIGERLLGLPRDPKPLADVRKDS